MAKDLGDAIGTALGRVAREAAHTVADNAKKTSKNGSLSGAKGVAAGAGLAMLVPLAAKGAGKLAHGAKDVVGKGMKEGVDKTVDKAGGAGGIAKKVAKDAIPGVGGGGDGGSGQKNEEEGVGKGRRMPIQQSVDIGAPIATVYKEWTQYEEWPTFMHRLQNVSQEDDSHVSFKTKIWGISKEFNAEIVEEEPEQRIKWKVTDGVTHTGVVTFHELADRLTHVEVNLDVDPGSLIEKAGRGMRHVKRAVRADLARFKAHVMMQEDDSSSSSRSRSSASSRSRSSSSSRSKSSGSGSRSKSSGSSSRGRSSSSKSSNGSSGSSRRTTAKSRSSSSNGRSSGSRSGSSRKKSGSRS
jgi:uncharacterized membrane protein